jgi:nucleoside-triphosphatase THEP1
MLSQHEVVKMKIAELGERLENKMPNIATLLREIRATLKSDKETVTLLTEEEINTIVTSIKKLSNIVLINKSAKSKKVTIDFNEL